jgi:2-polyprenyl-3-methyl-5-hydroxy-6-metoxy-1,4-benzoquinol methylase
MHSCSASPTTHGGHVTDFQGVVDAWEKDGQAGGPSIHPLEPDSPEFWELGRLQAQVVDLYAERGDFVIDFGCGIGRLSLPLAMAGYNVLAVDASQAMLDGLAERSKLAGVEFGAYRSDGSDLPDTVDHIIGERAAVVIARAVLIHHDYAGVEAIVRNLAAVLRPGGHLIADWPVSDTPRERRDWIDVTTWDRRHRHRIAAAAGLEPVITPVVEPSVWRKR